MSARLFIALEVGEEDRAALAAWAAEVVGGDPGLRPVDPAAIHVTLAFLGHRPLADVEPLRALVETLGDGTGGWGPSPLTTAGALWLSPRRPHVLTVAVADPAGMLAALHRRVWDALGSRLGLAPEARAFRPHLTVARVRRGWTPPSRRLPDPPERTLRPTGLVLFRSWLGGGPARYEPLSRAPFSTAS